MQPSIKSDIELQKNIVLAFLVERVKQPTMSITLSVSDKFTAHWQPLVVPTYF